MVQQVKVLAAKSHDLSSAPETNIVGGENQLLRMLSKLGFYSYEQTP